MPHFNLYSYFEGIARFYVKLMVYIYFLNKIIRNGLCRNACIF
ncbi:hypothetical protein AAZX31_14G170100 [Glycine max]